MRQAFKSGFVVGGAKAWMMSVTKGAFPGSTISIEEDAAEPREKVAPSEEPSRNGAEPLSKVDAVFRSGNATRDDIPSHLIVGEDLPAEVVEFYEHLCPAGVYERDGEKLVVNAPNCVDCKATDVVGPRWTPREGGERARLQADVAAYSAPARKSSGVSGGSRSTWGRSAIRSPSAPAVWVLIQAHTTSSSRVISNARPFCESVISVFPFGRRWAAPQTLE